MTVGSTRPALEEDLQEDLTGSEVFFYARHAGSSELLIEERPAVIVGPPSDGVVRYQWRAIDVGTAGGFLYWWKIVNADGGERSTTERPLIFDAVGPGVGVPTGAIARRSRSKIPVSWDALARYSGYGDGELQATVEIVKLTVIGGSVSAAAERALDARVVDHMAKLVVVQLVPPAIDYWMDQLQERTIRDPEETEVYPNRIAALEKLHQRLLVETRQERTAIDAIVGRVESDAGSEAPGIDSLGREWVTPDWREMQHPYLSPTVSTL